MTHPPGRRFLIQVGLPVLALVAVLLGATVLLANNDGKTKLPGGARRTSAVSYRGGVVTPTQSAPPIALNNYLGKPVTLGQYRGEVALVTFLYTHCPDVCPLIVSNLKVAQSKLGSGKVQIIAVSVDPRGDSRRSVSTFLASRGMTGKMQYLIGSAHALARVWSAWNVGSERDSANPEFVAHSGLVYGVTASGKLKTIYPANFKPADIVHDVPKLAAL